jgi:hypothetical protein
MLIDLKQFFSISLSEVVQSNLSTTTTLSTPKLWTLLTGGRCSEVWFIIIVKTGRQNSGRCWEVVVSSGLNVYQWRQIWNNLYFSQVFNLFKYCYFLFSNLNVKFFIFLLHSFFAKRGCGIVCESGRGISIMTLYECVCVRVIPNLWKCTTSSAELNAHQSRRQVSGVEYPPRTTTTTRTELTTHK